MLSSWCLNFHKPQGWKPPWVWLLSPSCSLAYCGQDTNDPLAIGPAQALSLGAQVLKLQQGRVRVPAILSHELCDLQQVT